MKSKNQCLWLFVCGLILTLLTSCGGAEPRPPEPTTPAEPTTAPTAVPTAVPTPVPTNTPVPITLSWNQKTDMPIPRFGHAASVVDGKIYVIGGGGPGGELITAVDVYDPATDSWTTKAEIPTARKWLATSVMDGKIYAIGGVSGSNRGSEPLATVEMYDPATDTWITKANLPSARSDMAAVTLDGMIYVIGGYVQKDDGKVNISGKVEIYDSATDTWSLGKNMHISMEAKAVVVDGKIYATAGGTGETYDPARERWTAFPRVTGQVSAISISALEGKVFAFGGLDGWVATPISSMFLYDPILDTWTQLADMPFNGWLFSASEMDGKIYLIGGLDQHPDESYFDPQPLSSVWEVTIDS